MIQKYSLKYVPDNPETCRYVDQDEVCYEDPYQWLWFILGGCGCESSEELSKKAYKVLELFAAEHGKRHFSISDNYLYEVIAHWMYSLDITEHGVSIKFSWLTPKGQQIFQAMQSLLNKQNKNENI